jgi:hypothetical protein
MLQPLTLKVSGRAVRPLVVPQYPLVMVITGGYHVDLGPSGSRRAPRFHLVLKDRTCNCGAMDCQGLRAVENYLKAGGLRAPDGSALKSLTGPCPICHGATRAMDGRWECLENHTHYFQYRVTRLRAAREKWLMSLTPDVATYHAEVRMAFADPAARAAFLAEHPLTYAAGA